MIRRFYEWSGGTPQDHEALAWFSGARPEQMGPLLASFRSGVVAAVWAKVVLTVAGVSLALVALTVAADPSVERTIAAVLAVVGLAAVVVVVMIVVALVARRYRHDVHAHGLVLHGPMANEQVIPWATIDPGRVFIGRTLRAITRMPAALGRQRAMFAPAVMVNGWTSRPQGSNEVFEQFSADYRYQPRPIDSPFGWWQLGVTDPRSFLMAIESAMVADGYPAAGLTPFALSRRYTARDLRRDPRIQQERALEDPVLGLPSADQPRGPHRP